MYRYISRSGKREKREREREGWGGGKGKNMKVNEVYSLADQ